MRRDNSKQFEECPGLVALELTKRCNLKCVHCRAQADNSGKHEDKLTIAQWQHIIKSISKLGRPLLIFTGGEPLMREDWMLLAEFAHSLGLPIALATNGTLINLENAWLIAEKVNYVSVSIDYPDNQQHDVFRGVQGSFVRVLQGLDALRAVKVPFIINTTVTRQNFELLPDMLELVRRSGAAAWHVFIMVPSGRAATALENILSPMEYNRALTFLWESHKLVPIIPACAPHYTVLAKRHKDTFKLKLATCEIKEPHLRRGCMAGFGFSFVSHIGDVYPCGYFQLTCGNSLKEEFGYIYRQSRVMLELRDQQKFTGHCGSCLKWEICGGCRTRAWAITGDYLGPDPYCGRVLRDMIEKTTKGLVAT